MAKAFVASNMAAARPYYERFPQEPVNAREFVAVDSVRLFNATAAALFAAVRQSCERGDVLVIVAHSSEHGVALRLVAGCPFGLNVDNVNRIMSVVRQPQAAREAAVGELAHDAGLDARDATSLVSDIAAVQALGLAAVHFRGCNLGAWEDTPPVFRSLFGCQLVTGLNIRSAYAGLSPAILTGTPQARTARFNRLIRGPARTEVVVDGEPPDRFAYRCAINPSTHLLSFTDVVAESDQAVPAFIRRHLPAARPPYTRGRLPIHALLNLGDLIFPYANGMPSSEYASHIRAS